MLEAKTVFNALTGKSGAEREIVRLNNQITSLQAKLRISNTQNARYWHVLNQLLTFHKKDFEKRWFSTPFSVSPYAIIKTALDSNNKEIRLISRVPAEYKHHARNLANLSYYIVEKNMSIKKALKKVVEQRGESFRRMKWKDSSHPYTRKA